MRSFLNLFRKKPVDGATVLGRVDPADAAMIGCNLFPEGQVAKPFGPSEMRQQPRAYPFNRGSQKDQMVVALLRGRTMNSDNSRMLVGGPGSGGDRALRGVRVWLKSQGLAVVQRTIPVRRGRPMVAVKLHADSISKVRALREREAKK